MKEIGFKTSSEFYNNQYKHIIYEDDKLLPYFTENHKYEFVKATQGCGKTHCSLDYIQQNPKLKFLYVSIGKAIGQDFLNSCKTRNITVDHYENKKFNTKTQVHIWEYESLWKIKYTDFDVLILDEFVSLINNTIISSTNGKHIRSNFNILKTFVHKAQNVLCLSADINPSIVNTFLNEFNIKDAPVLIQENEKIILLIQHIPCFLTNIFL